MTFHWKLPLAAAVCALSLGVGGAVAAGPKAGPQRGAVKAAAAYIGVTVEALRQELKAGNSLANSALAHGKTVEGLEAAIVADAKTHLDAAVAAGKLTSEQAARILQNLQRRVAEIVMRTGQTAGKGKPGHAKGKGKAAAAIRGAIKAASTYLGLTTEQIRTQLRAGKSLADIAAAQGKSVEGLKAAIVADAKAVIDRLVAEGKISAERGQRYLEQVKARVGALVTKTLPGKDK